ncbi:MAG: NAD-dependent protein deacylase [Bacillota bacterium]
MIKALTQMIQEARHGVFLGGAGVSTESDIPDFRSEGGLYSKLRERYEKPEDFLSYSFFIENITEFYDIFRNQIMLPRLEPNRAHYALARMERDGKLKAVITQNTDGLHMKAGSRTVYELHGSSHRNPCMVCGKVYDREFVKYAPGPVPVCTRCGGVVRPGVTLFGEALPAGVLEKSVKAVKEADLFIVGGTSLVVYPAAGLIRRFSGRNLVIINREPTQFDDRASLVFRESIGEVLSSAWPDKS